MNDRHEQSRAAFEDRYHRHALTRLIIQGVDFYSDPVIHERWLEWCRALDYAADQQAAPNWLPIETAPKNGDKMLFLCPFFGVISGGKWSDDKYNKKSRPYWTHHGESIWGKTYTRMHQPTHWMPLPATSPPAPSQANTEQP